MGKRTNRRQRQLVAKGMDPAEAWIKVGKTDRGTATMLREKYDYYLDLGLPVENEILGDLFNPEAMNRQVLEAQGLVSSGFDSARTGTADYRSRYGDTRTDQERQFEERRSQLREQLAKTEAADNVRGMVFDRDINTATDMARIGRGMSSSATAGMISASGKEAQRDVAYEQAKAQDRVSTLGMAASGAAIGTMIAPGIGTVVGGVIGAGVGMLS